MTLAQHDELHPELAYINPLLSKTLQNRDLTWRLFKKLFLELPEHITQLESLLTAEEIWQAQQVIHKLHGSVSFCGFTELQELSQRVEKSLFADDLEQANHSFVLLKEKLAIFQSLQEKILQQLEK